MLYKKLITDNLTSPKTAVSTRSGTYTYEDLHNKVTELQKILEGRGVSEGQFAMIRNANTIHTITAILTCIRMRICFVIVPEDCTESQVESISREAAPRVFLEEPSNGGNGITDFHFPKYGIQRDLVYVIYTSGSAGKPKGVMAPESQVEFCIEAINERLNNGPCDRILCCLPLSFDYGLYQLFMALEYQSTLVIPEKYTLSEIPGMLAKEKITAFPVLPSTIGGLLYSRMLERVKPANLRYITSTGDNFPVEMIQRLIRVLPGTRIIPMYGQTECKRVSIMPEGRMDKIMAGSCGLPLTGTRVWLDQPDENGVGELIVSGPNIMGGYLNAGEVTAEYFFEDPTFGRCLRTGDLFSIDPEGFLYFISRKKRILKVSGRRIGCLELEELFGGALAGHQIRELRIVGLPDPLYGEKIILCISSGQPADILKKAVSGVNDTQDCYRRVSGIYLTENEFPKTANGKIDDKRLMEEASIHGTIAL